MGKHKTDIQWKEELEGKQFGRLTVIDVKNKRAICSCICGNRKEVIIHHLLSGHTTSCGCYKKSKEKANKYSEWCKKNPDKIKEQGKKHSEWFKNNPEKKIAWKIKIKERCNTREYKEKLSCIRREYLSEHPEIREKQSKRMKELCRQNPEYVKKQTQYIRNWYRDNPDKVKEKASKYSEWCKKNPDKIKDIVEKRKQWFIKNKNTLNKIADIHRLFYQRKRKTNITEKGASILKKILTKDDYIRFCSGALTSKDIITIKCPTCSKEIKCSFGNLFILERNELKRNIPRCSTCRTASSYEQEIENYISLFYKGVCIRNNREIIPPYELDLFYPNLNIAIEVNGWFWHSTLYKHKNFHYLKWKFCLDHGIHLISLFEQDLLVKKDKVLSFLKNIFSTPIFISYKDCSLKEVDCKSSYSFLNENSVEDFCLTDTQTLGLFYNNTLISCFCFKHDNRNIFEVVTMQTKYGYSVNKGFEYLFNYFLEKYNPSMVTAYTNNDFSIGKELTSLGFNLVYNKEILNYQWIKNKSIIGEKDSLLKEIIESQRYKDLVVENKEMYIMNKLGYVQVYRCGKSKWLWTNPIN